MKKLESILNDLLGCGKPNLPKKFTMKEGIRLFQSQCGKNIKTFYETTDYKMRCTEITGQSFKKIAEHTEFIKNGGCDKLITVLADKSALSL
jgi:hypothetical protein